MVRVRRFVARAGRLGRWVATPVRLTALVGVLLLGGVAAGASAQTAPGFPQGMTVSGQASASQPPDQAPVFGSVVTQADTPAAATDENSRILTAIITALKGIGVADDDIQTSGFNVSPQYSYIQPQPGEASQPPTIIGYQANNGVSVKTKNLKQIGALFQAMANAGATNLSGPAYSLQDPEQLRLRAIQAASDDALQKARAAAAALGVRVGAVISFNEGFSNAPFAAAPPPPAPAPATARPTAVAQIAPPVVPTDLTATASVTVVFAIINP